MFISIFYFKVTYVFHKSMFNCAIHSSIIDRIFFVFGITMLKCSTFLDESRKYNKHKFLPHFFSTIEIKSAPKEIKI